MLRTRALFVLCLVSFGASCSQSPPNNPDTQRLVVCLYADVSTLDIRVQTTRNLRSVVGNIHDTLVGLSGETLVLTPQLATSWENRDPLTWRLHLRRGVSFTNGEPFNAQAVKYSIESQQSGRGSVRTYLSNIAEVRAVDDFTVDLVTARPDVMTIRNLTGAYMYPPEYGRTAGDAFAQRPIGSGPFTFVEWRKGESVTLQANRAYWDTSLWPNGPPVDTVVFRVCPNPATRIAMLLTGEADVIDNLPPEQLTRLAGQPRISIIKFPGYKRFFLHIDARQGSARPLDDVRVRRALNYAIDRRAIIASLLPEQAVPYRGFVQEGLPDAPAALEPYEFDRSKARALMAEAGLRDGFDVDLFSPVGAYVKDKEVSEAIQAQLREIGVRARLLPMEYADYTSRHSALELRGLTLNRRLVNTGDPVDGYLYMLASKGGAPYIPTPRFDGMLNEANGLFDPAARSRYLATVVEPFVWNELVPEVSLYDLVDAFAVSDRIKWHPVNRQEQIDLRGLGRSTWP
jgi:peptide/nickel transport system substrate-binding protein